MCFSPPVASRNLVSQYRYRACLLLSDLQKVRDSRVRTPGHLIDIFATCNWWLVITQPPEALRPTVLKPCKRRIPSLTPMFLLSQRHQAAVVRVGGVRLRKLLHAVLEELENHEEDDEGPQGGAPDNWHV